MVFSRKKDIKTYKCNRLLGFCFFVFLVKVEKKVLPRKRQFSILYRNPFGFSLFFLMKESNLFHIIPVCPAAGNKTDKSPEETKNHGETVIVQRRSPPQIARRG
jgi:hypothetical protein